MENETDNRFIHVPDQWITLPPGNEIIENGDFKHV